MHCCPLEFNVTDAPHIHYVIMFLLDKGNTTICNATVPHPKSSREGSSLAERLQPLSLNPSHSRSVPRQPPHVLCCWKWVETTPSSAAFPTRAGESEAAVSCVPAPQVASLAAAAGSTADAGGSMLDKFEIRSGTLPKCIYVMPEYLSELEERSLLTELESTKARWHQVGLQRSVLRAQVHQRMQLAVSLLCAALL